MRTSVAKKADRSKSHDLTIEQRTLASLKPYLNNAKTHDSKQLKLIAKSIIEHGFYNPILIDENAEIIAGHGRFEAAKLAGLMSVPTLMLSHLSEAQKKKLRIADNRLAEVGTGWSMDLLRLEIDAITEIEIDFDIGTIGFEKRAFEIGLDVVDASRDAEDPPIPDVGTRAVTRLGDLFEIGDHKLICGDATQSETYAALLGKERAAMVFTDPPYGVPINGHVSGNGKAKFREFIMGGFEMSDAEFQQFLTKFMLLTAKYSRNGSLHYICMDWRHIRHLLAAGLVAYDDYKNLCVWTKSNGGMGSLYRSQHELVAIFKKGDAPHINQVELGKHGRNRSNVWPYPGMNSFSRERDEALTIHPTVKPLALVRDAILDASEREDVILDPFGGSGTTLLAADAVRRRVRLIELDPLYCDVILRRAEQALGIKAVLVATGQTFDEVAAARSAADA